MFNKGTSLFDFINAKESVQGKGKQSSEKFLFKVLRSLSYYLNVTDPLIIPVNFIFLSCREKVHDNKEFSGKISKPRCE